MAVGILSWSKERILKGFKGRKRSSLEVGIQFAGGEEAKASTFSKRASAMQLWIFWGGAERNISQNIRRKRDAQGNGHDSGRRERKVLIFEGI